jgi:hypothetical protein
MKALEAQPVQSLSFGSEPECSGSKTVYDAPLVFEGRTLDPVATSLHPNRGRSGPPVRSDRRAHRARLPAARASRRGLKQPAAEARSGWSRIYKQAGRASLQGDLRATDHEVAVRVI